MAKILFVNPAIREEDDPKHVPYGMALMAALADKLGHQVQVYDANAWRLSDKELCDALQADQWDVVATGSITTAYGYIKKTVQYAERFAPQALVILGGGVLTSMPVDIMGFLPQVDIGIIGEAFKTFPQLLSMIDQADHDWSKVLGVAYRDRDGQVQLTDPQPLLSMEELDQLPYPAWDMFPLDIYWRNSSLLYSEEAFTSKRRLDVNMSYGCSLICRFCFHLGLSGDLEYTKNEKGQRDTGFGYKRTIRWHSSKYVIDMVKHARDKFGIDFVLFLDENLMTMNSYSHYKWLPEIADLWIKEGLQPKCRREGKPHDTSCRGVHWGGTSHATLVRKDLLAKLYESGCSQLLYGYESFSDRILQNLGKGTTAAINERSLHWTMDSGIRPIPNQIIGFPDEWFDSIKDCMHAWERTGIQVKPFFATPYPGSEWYYTYKDRILEQYKGDLEAFLLDLGDATKITAIISENFDAVELLGLRELMVNRDFKHIEEYEREWIKRHGKPFIPDFRHNPRVPNKKLREIQGAPPRELGLANGSIEQVAATVVSSAREQGSAAGAVEAQLAHSRARCEWPLQMLREHVFARHQAPKIAVWGLASQPNAASTKHTPSLALLEALADQSVTVYDPRVRLSETGHGGARQAEAAIEAARDAHVVVIMTPWPEFASTDWRTLHAVMTDQVIIDPFQAVDGLRCAAAGFQYIRRGAKLGPLASPATALAGV